MSNTGRSRSVAAALAWIMVPWRDWALATALIASAAAPAFLISTANIWKAEAADEIAIRIAQAGPASDQTVVVESPAFFAAAPSLEADRIISAELDRIDGYGSIQRTLLSNTSSRGAVVTAEGRQINVPIRFVSHTDALESVTPVATLDGSPRGVWISTWLANFADLELGDQLVSGACFEAPMQDPCSDDVPRTPVTVVGIYETLWNEERSPDGLDVIPGLDRALIPRYLNPFRLPNYALLLTTEALMEDLQVRGTARWSATLDSDVGGFAELEGRVRSVRQLGQNVATSNSVGRPLESLSAGQGSPAVSTTLPDTLADTLVALRTLDQPFQSVTFSGCP